MKIKCRYCGKQFEYNSENKQQHKHFPFCSERCKLADLGKWFNENYRVSDPIHEPEDLPEKDRCE